MNNEINMGPFYRLKDSNENVYLVRRDKVLVICKNTSSASEKYVCIIDKELPIYFNSIQECCGHNEMKKWHLEGYLTGDIIGK